MQRLILILSALCLSTSLSGQKTGTVLAEGEWVKVGITERGVRRIDADFLSGYLDVTGIDAARIALYGNGGKMLPQANAAPRINDLKEIPIWIQGGEDGVLDPQDQIYFFAEDPHTIRFNEGEKIFELENHIYSDTSFYFLTISADNAKRITQETGPSGSYPEIRTFDDYQFHEEDQVNFITSGREWYGERIGTAPESFRFQNSERMGNTNLSVTASVMGRSFDEASFNVNYNGNSLGEIPIAPVSTYIYGTQGREETRIFTISADAGDQHEVSLSFSDNSGVGILNYLLIQYVSPLQLNGAETIFRSIQSTTQPVSTFTLDNASPAARVWDVTASLEPAEISTTVSNNTLQFNAETDQLREFVAFVPGADIPYPESIKPVENQDLHGMQTPELLVVTHPRFKVAAERLAALREEEGISTTVVSIEEVYNEFSSGSQDVTAIRDFARYLYLNPGEDSLRYLLLFGRASFDYKDFRKPNTNFVPTYQSRNSLHKVLSYSSDDYYGFMEASEGEWPESFSGDHTLDIAVGRLPVTTPSEANAVVNKLIRYSTQRNSLGTWRNDLYFVADDGDDTDGTIHQRQADQIATYIDTTLTQMNIHKLYVDAYEQIQQAGGELAPHLNAAINQAMDDGAFIINFTGHGGERGWTEERILDFFMIDQWSNADRMPLFVTATCEFGRFDNPSLVSGGERTLFNPNGGAIGLVTTTRPVASSTNFILNRAFYRAALEKVNGRFKKLGDIFRDTKNSSLNGANNRNFSLLGDPSMELAFPEYGARITHLNDSPIAGNEVLNALSYVTLKGEIYDPADGSVIPGFEGTASIEIYEKVQQMKTLGNRTPVMQYDEWREVIFRGSATVINGVFEVSFIVPKNISYQVGKGRINLYATPDTGLSDAAGGSLQLAVGGSTPTPEVDTTPPTISLFMGDSSFVDGELTNSNTELVAYFSDESGISTTSGGPGQEMVAILDDQIEYKLNSFYQTLRDDFTTGVVKFPIRDLAPGEHMLRVRALDTHNNISEATIRFAVLEEGQIMIENLRSYPNPFSSNATISFRHNRNGEDLEVTLTVFSTRGEILNQSNWLIPESPVVVNDLRWNGTNADGSPLAEGIYIYQIGVRSQHDGAFAGASQKMIRLE